MIEYDFSQLIQDQAFVNISLVEKIANSLPNSLNEDTFIDTIWEKMEALVCSESPDIDSDIAASLKEDVLMSLYVSAKYTTMEEQKFSIIDDALKDTHTTATKEDSLDSIKKGLHSLRKEIRESFHVAVMS